MEHATEPDREKALRESARDFGVDIPPGQAGKLVRLADMVLEANTRFNLTTITAWDDFRAKHLLDSLAPLSLGLRIPPGRTVADMGSGAGFPGLVLAAMTPGASFSLIEARGKKAAFLEEAAAGLGLDNVRVMARRVEEASGGEREAFDLVAVRAMAELAALVELAHPLLRTGGELWAWKGPETGGEIGGAGVALSRLGAEVRADLAYELPGGGGGRRLLVIAKTGPTPPGFPRRPGMAQKKPLK